MTLEDVMRRVGCLEESGKRVSAALVRQSAELKSAEQKLDYLVGRDMAQDERLAEMHDILLRMDERRKVVGRIAKWLVTGLGVCGTAVGIAAGLLKLVG